MIYAVTYTVTVEADSEEEAIKESRKYIAREYRGAWNPTVTEVKT